MMKIENLVLSSDPKRNDFLVGCMPLHSWDSCKEEAAEILNNADNSEQVIDQILSSDTMRGTQIYAELSKDQPGHRDRVMRDLDSWYESWSDAGGLKIGAAGMSIVIPNGYGDGKMYWTEVGKNCLNSSMLTFWTSVSGTEINVYDYDCSGGNVVKVLNGRYGIYYGYGLIVFERWGDAE